MGVTYSLYRPNSLSKDTSTQAEVTANEGLLSASLGSPATFTFDVPDGLWAFARVVVTVGSASAYNIPVLLSSDMSGTGTPGAKHSINGSLSPFVLGDTFSSGTGTDGQVFAVFPLSGLTAGTVSGYTCYTSLEPGVSSASVVLEVTDTHGGTLSAVSAVMTLQSITPEPPFADFSGQNSATGPPYAGTASATLPVTYDLVGPKDGGSAPNGLPPLSYQWQNVPYGPGTATGTSGQSTPPDALPDAWSFPSLYEETGGVGIVNVFVTLTNSPYPHQVDAPRFASYGGDFAYRVTSTAVITPNAAYALAEDAHRRPVALTPNKAGPLNARTGPSGIFATSINGLVSNDAGRTYLEDYVSDVGYAGSANFGADNPSLLVDRRSNHYRAVYSRSGSSAVYGEPGSTPFTEMIVATGLLDDRFSQVAGSPAVIPALSGGLCAAAQHPTDADFALLVYSDIGTTASPGSLDLRCAQSLDAGATWKPLPTILPALDLRATGRPALCWLGDTAILVYSAGMTLSCLTSIDRGQSWQAAETVSTYTPGGSGSSGASSLTDFHYFCLSLASHGGQVYLLAFVGDTQARGLTQVTSLAPPQTSPRLFVRGQPGQPWTLRAAEKPVSTSAPAEFTAPPPGALPAIQAPSGIGVSPFSGLLRLDTTYVSADCGLTWTFSVLGQTA